jgi:hypothetical protein
VGHVSELNTPLGLLRRLVGMQIDGFDFVLNTLILRFGRSRKEIHEGRTLEVFECGLQVDPCWCIRRDGNILVGSGDYQRNDEDDSIERRAIGAMAERFEMLDDGSDCVVEAQVTAPAGFQLRLRSGYEIHYFHTCGVDASKEDAWWIKTGFGSSDAFFVMEDGSVVQHNDLEE